MTTTFIKVVGFATWAVLGVWMYLEEFGAVFFLCSLMLGVWLSLDTSQRKGPSAYNIFNNNGEKLAGTFAPADQMMLPGMKKEKNQFYSASEALESDDKRKPRYTGKKVPRNSPCPCRSGKKYSKCCGNASYKNITYDDLSSSDSD
eukprot:TRINITY_DN17171_c0_g1_i1.p1 TRINITY_DN17171_c0_g1~~TRINITY_DN17171_c0_g1_i1.p1  ORF type:complete len:146 (+),score=25.64 TRINITY_DN17171_c0_g1_i1:1-438(+)